MNKMDGSYRQLLSNPELVRDLFVGIVSNSAIMGAEWRLEAGSASGPGLSSVSGRAAGAGEGDVDYSFLSDLDWSRLTALPSDYIGRDLEQRQGDCVWYLPRHEADHHSGSRKGRLRSQADDIYIILMLEHQSTNDQAMALRMQVYALLLYQRLLADKRIAVDRFWPVILPVVLYSGVRPWSAPRCLSQLMDSPPSVLLLYQPRMRYLLVDEGRLVRDGKLPAGNLASLLFRLEHNRGIADTQQLVQTIWDATQGEQYTELRRAFTAWLRHVILPRALPDVALPKTEHLLEIKTMLTDESRSWVHQWKQEGRLEGRQEGTSALLGRLLQRRFGALPAPVQQRLTNATLDELEVWSLKVLDAKTLEDVFH